MALSAILGAPSSPLAQEGAGRIRLNQVGFAPTAPKSVVVADTVATRFAVLDVASGDTVFRGALAPPGSWAASGEFVRRGDFSAVVRPGKYTVIIPGVGRSYIFRIDSAAVADVARAAIKAFYFQRASTDLPPRYASRWSRTGGHPDTAVLVHPSAAGPRRVTGTIIRSPGGWYDAGDYNKYVVNSGISTYTLLLAAEQYPAFTKSLTTNIPESGNGLPDALDEALWNVHWMLTMQDPADGGVYHKLTNAAFDAFIAPVLATTPRYVVEKTTAATLDFAAVCAHAALVVRHYSPVLPGLADTLVQVAVAAWTWASLHPDVLYDQDLLNKRFSTSITTGAYGDRDLSDEFDWAGAELYLATGRATFLTSAVAVANARADVPSWPSVRSLGLYSLLEHRRDLPASVDTNRLRLRLLHLADELVARERQSAYAVPIDGQRDFVWGSNGVAANEGMALLQAYRLTGKAEYLHGAVSALDYLLGRNATGYSFVTGLGTKTPRHPHHRLSSSDTVADPIPGLLVGGPNPGQQDHCTGYPSRMPAMSYLDDVCSYASNEIAINWNAPLAYLATAIAAEYSR